MYTRTFHCTDFEGNPFDVTYDFFLSKADLLKINFLDLTGLDALLKKLIDAKKGREIMDLLDTPAVESRRDTEVIKAYTVGEAADILNQAAEALLQTGARDVCFIGNGEEKVFVRERAEGFRAAAEASGAKDALIAGGVASSRLLREMLSRRNEKRRTGLRLYFGQPEFSGDNAVGVALIGLEKLNRLSSDGGQRST